MSCHSYNFLPFRTWRPWLLGCSIILLTTTLAAADDRASLGLNLAGIADYSAEWPFVDAFTRARPWISQREGKSWGEGPPLATTPEGWVARLEPGCYAETVVTTDVPNPTGPYVCTYEGTGEVRLNGAVADVESRPGRIDFAMKPGSLFLQVRATDPSDPVRAIRVVPRDAPATAADRPFAPAFLERIGRFRVLRFMDWMDTNDSKVERWADRPTPGRAGYAAKGVPVEVMVDLCNQTGIDPWFCMPHLADDDYVRRFARLVREKLGPDRRAYVEHSNEVWNGQFAQARHALERGKALGLSDNDFQAQLFYHSRRSVEVFKIWEAEFGGADRLVRVLGSQSANPWVSEQVSGFEDAYKHADALAIAPYFGNELGSPKTADEVAAMPIDAIVARCREDIRANRDKIAEAAAKARALGLDLIAYEGGQHLTGHGGAENVEALTAKLIAANRDPRMRELYLEDLASWKAAGGGLFVAFSSVARPTKWGSWGLLESEAQDPAKAPKYQAILEFMKNKPSWWDAPRRSR